MNMLFAFIHLALLSSFVQSIYLSNGEEQRTNTKKKRPKFYNRAETLFPSPYANTSSFISPDTTNNYLTFSIPSSSSSGYSSQNEANSFPFLDAFFVTSSVSVASATTSSSSQSLQFTTSATGDFSNTNYITTSAASGTTESQTSNSYESSNTNTFSTAFSGSSTLAFISSSFAGSSNFVSSTPISISDSSQQTNSATKTSLLSSTPETDLVPTSETAFSSTQDITSSPTSETTSIQFSSSFSTQETTSSPTPETTSSPSPEATSSPTPETTSSPTPETTSSPAPETTSSPTPETTSSPTPDTTSSPSPEATSSPTPETTASPTPETTASPTPEATSSPTPETTSSPSPETTASPTPETTSSPTPETTSSPNPESTYAPSPETTSSPSPETTSSPTPETTSSPAPETTSSPAPETTSSPSSESTFSPNPESTYAPNPESTYAPNPEASLLPFPESTYSPTLATTSSPISETNTAVVPITTYDVDTFTSIPITEPFSSGSLTEFTESSDDYEYWTFSTNWIDYTGTGNEWPGLIVDTAGSSIFTFDLGSSFSGSSALSTSNDYTGIQLKTSSPTFKSTSASKVSPTSTLDSLTTVPSLSPSSSTMIDVTTSISFESDISPTTSETLSTSVFTTSSSVKATGPSKLTETSITESSTMEVSTVLSSTAETTSSPIPETTSSPTAETTSSPTAETTSSPIPETTSSPIPKTTSSPIPGATYASITEPSTVLSTSFEGITSNQLSKISSTLGPEPAVTNTFSSLSFSTTSTSAFYTSIKSSESSTMFYLTTSTPPNSPFTSSNPEIPIETSNEKSTTTQNEPVETESGDFTTLVPSSAISASISVTAFVSEQAVSDTTGSTLTLSSLSVTTDTRGVETTLSEGTAVSQATTLLETRASQATTTAPSSGPVSINSAQSSAVTTTLANAHSSTESPLGVGQNTDATTETSFSYASRGSGEITGITTPSSLVDFSQQMSGATAATASALATTSYWLPYSLVTTYIVTKPSASNLHTTAPQTAIATSLPQAIYPQSSVSVPVDYTVIGIAFEEAFNYEYLLNSYIAAAQIINFLPELLKYPFLHSDYQKREVVNKGSLKAASNFEYVAVVEIVPYYDSSYDYILSVAKVSFPTASVTHLQALISNRKSSLYTVADKTLSSLAALINSDFKIMSDTWLSSALQSGYTVTTQSVKQTITTDYVTVSNGTPITVYTTFQTYVPVTATIANSQRGPHVTDNSNGSLDQYHSSTSMNKRTRNRFIIYITCLSVGFLLIVFVLFFLLQGIFSITKIQKLLSHDLERGHSIPQELLLPVLWPAFSSDLTGSEPDTDRGSHYTENSNGGHSQLNEKETECSSLESANFNTTRGSLVTEGTLRYFVDQDGNYYYAGESTGEEDASDNFSGHEDSDSPFYDEGINSEEDISIPELPSVEVESVTHDDIEVDEDGNVLIDMGTEFDMTDQPGFMDPSSELTPERLEKLLQEKLLQNSGVSADGEQDPMGTKSLNELLNLSDSGPTTDEIIANSIINDQELHEFLYSDMGSDSYGNSSSNNNSSNNTTPNYSSNSMSNYFSSNSEERTSDVSDVNVGEIDTLDAEIYLRIKPYYEKALPGLVRQVRTRSSTNANDTP